MVKKRNRKNETDFLEVSRDVVVPTESFRQESRGVFTSEVGGLDLGIDLNRNKEISSASFSLIERPARSSEEGKVLWERKIVKDEQNGIEIRESWDSEVLNEREDDAVVPTVKEDYKGDVEKISENSTNQEEIVIRSSKWQTEKNEFEEKLTIKFDRWLISETLKSNANNYYITNAYLVVAQQLRPVTKVTVWQVFILLQVPGMSSIHDA